MDKIAQEWTKQADEIKQTMDNAVAKQQDEIQQTLEKNYEEWKQDSMEFEMKVASDMKRDCAFQIQKSEDRTHVLLEQVKQIAKSSTTGKWKRADRNQRAFEEHQHERGQHRGEESQGW